MKCTLQGSRIVLAQVGDAYDALRKCPSYRWNRRAGTMEAPISVEALECLKEIVGEQFPERLQRGLEILKRREKMLQEQRESLSGEVKPLVHYPVKAKLMRHQIAGANMAMIVFGECDMAE